MKRGLELEEGVLKVIQKEQEWHSTGPESIFYEATR